MLTETYRDLDQLVHFVEEAQKFQPKHDDKLRELIRLLGTKDLVNEKVLVFTEFADTARYLKRELDKAGIQGVGEVDSATKGNRADVIKRFACERQAGDPRADLHRRLVRRPQPSGRLPDDQLRHPLESGEAHAAHRSGGPTDEPRGREAARGRSP
jgi:hypothetical protein